MLRGKFEALNEVVTRKLIVGDSPIRMLECGCWINKSTGKRVVVKTYSMAKFQELINLKHACEV